MHRVKLTRRNYLQGALGTVAGSYANASLTAVASAPVEKRTGFQLCELFGEPASQDVKIAKQLGVTQVIAGMNLSRVRREDYLYSDFCLLYSSIVEFLNDPSLSGFGIQDG